MRPAFAAEDLSVVLLYYVEAELARVAGGIEALRSRLSSAEGRVQVQRMLAARMDVNNPQTLGQLREIPLAEGLDLVRLLRRDAYRTRILDVALERLRIGADAPALRIAPEAQRCASGDLCFALIYGAETVLFQDTVLALQSDEQAGREAVGRAVTILGVHHTWLDDRMRAWRALVADRPGRVCEVGFRAPQRIDVAEVLHLPREGEIALHRRISAACEDAGIVQVNPYGIAAERADDKAQACAIWRRMHVETPAARRVARGGGHREVVTTARALLGGRAATRLVVQPGHGTEGRLVEAACVNAGDAAFMRGRHPLVVHAAECILPHDDLLIREARGNVRFVVGQERRHIAFRMNVAWNGTRFVAESGFAQVAPDAATFAASRGRGGQIVTLDEAFRALCCKSDSGWRRFFPTAYDLAAIQEAAICAAVALNTGIPEAAFLKHMGVDIVLEVNLACLTSVVLEANARPAGLASSHEMPHSLSEHLRPKVTAEIFHFIAGLKGADRNARDRRDPGFKSGVPHDG